MEPISKKMSEASMAGMVDVTETEIQVTQPSTSADDMCKLIHMLNNHLTIVIGRGQLLVLGDKHPEIKEDITRIIDEAKEVSKIVRDIRSLVTSEGPMKS